MMLRKEIRTVKHGRRVRFTLDEINRLLGRVVQLQPGEPRAQTQRRGEENNTASRRARAALAPLVDRALRVRAKQARILSEFGADGHQANVLDVRAIGRYIKADLLPCVATPDPREARRALRP